jgi:hypothetical protein
VHWIDVAQDRDLYCGHRNEPLDSMKGREFIEQMSDC